MIFEISFSFEFSARFFSLPVEEVLFSASREADLVQLVCLIFTGSASLPAQWIQTAELFIHPSRTPVTLFRFHLLCLPPYPKAKKMMAPLHMLSRISFKIKAFRTLASGTIPCRIAFNLRVKPVVGFNKGSVSFLLPQIGQKPNLCLRIS